ncbi:hypothetical protein [Ferruginibacter sp. HRS2-29]|uniref:hypothetical protein n=1 Tax=Ferruginibacter sp. HRS2-29 TaxID=2487334 RepID=UPI0020CBAF75|nr:hypothetical protein [Ferruginibacter sp. HRS2-29]MCP9752466.1 hypothetical protein [Ferruginibacter sp. HRS2-29]
MKKFLIALSMLLATATVSFAQTATPSKTTEKKGFTTAPAKSSTTESSKLKADGTPDRRFKANKKLKKDGTADMRYNENKLKKMKN